MKTYKITGLLLCVLLCIGSSIDTNYYAAGQDIVRENFTYKCEKKYSTVRVYNVNNHWADIEQTRLNGQLMPIDLPDNVRAMTGSSIYQALNTIFEVANSVLSSAEKAMLRNAAAQARLRSEKEMIIVTVFIHSQTGAATEVEYSFSSNGSFSKIPPEKYFSIEQLLKQKIRVELTDEGRSRNYNVIVYPLSGGFFKQ